MGKDMSKRQQVEGNRQEQIRQGMGNRQGRTGMIAKKTGKKIDREIEDRANLIDQEK